MKNTIRLSRVSFFLTLFFVFYLALSSNPRPIQEYFFLYDKLNHTLAFATLSLLWNYASYQGEISIRVKVVPLLLVALALEVLQLAVKTRLFELADILAGAIGIAIYWILQFLTRRRLDHFLEKFIG